MFNLSLKVSKFRGLMVCPMAVCGSPEREGYPESGVNEPVFGAAKKNVNEFGPPREEKIGGEEVADQAFDHNFIFVESW